MILALISYVLVGCIAGYLAARIMGLDTSDITKNLLLGIVGSIVGGLIGELIGLRATGLLESLILAVVGACVAIWIYRRFIRK